MRARILAAGPAGLVVAAQLKLAGWAVEVLKAPRVRRLRPFRLRSADVVRLREIAALGGQDPSLLTFAPEFEAWGLPDGPRYRFALQGLEWRSDKWVLEDRLQDLLESALRSFGVPIRKLDPAGIPAPQLDPYKVNEPSPEEPLLIVETSPDLLPLWPLANRPTRVRLESCEVRLPHGRLAQVDACQVQRFEGCAAYLEPHPDSGFVLSLYGASKYPLERALTALRNPRGRGPSAWRALFMVNPGAEIAWQAYDIGVTDFYYPGVFALGAALGEMSPGVNLQLSEAMGQADRLVKMLTHSTATDPASSPRRWLQLGEKWSQDESRRIATSVRRSEAGERWCLEENSRNVVLPLTTLLPRPVRHYLRLPV